MSSTAPQIPPEVIDTIIDYLHADRPALATCSLVCKDWFHTSRYHLFARATLRPANVHTFLRLLAARYSTLAAFPRKLEIDESPPCPDEPRWLDLVIAYLNRLAEVNALCLRNLSTEAVCTVQRKGLLSVFWNITELELWDVHFVSFAQAINIICTFRSLERLLFSCFCDGRFHRYIPSSVHPQLPASLRTLELAGYHSKRDMLIWLSSNESTNQVHTLNLGTVYTSEMATIGRYLRTISPSLQHLRLRIWQLHGQVEMATFRDNISLSHCTHLRSITFDDLTTDRYRFSDDRSNSVMTCLPAMVSQINVAYLEEVAFTLPVHPDNSTQAVDWTAMDNLLAPLRLSGLQRIRFWVPSTLSIAQLEISIKECLPACSSYNLLCFTRQNSL